MTLMKSEAVSNPANVDVWEFHKGAETISRKLALSYGWVYYFVLDNEVPF